jgi:diaminohydroxyphosphoribosylaminopyrimidine deaminase/5-amino-6-(5-phosphoribosylamino)uracil reductase
MDRFMALAIRLARKADPRPNPRVGAVLVRDGLIIGTGYHRKAGMPHAEIEAIEDARRKSGRIDAAYGATLYVSLEPCSHRLKRTPPCTDAIIGCGIRKVVYAMKDPNPLVSGAAALRKAGLAVEGPVAQKEAGSINRRYISEVTKRPMVAIKMALSADGKSATRTGDSKWISGKDSRDMVHRMRSEYGAVMVGAGTIRCDEPALTAHGAGPDPFRIIIDGKLSTPFSSPILHNGDGRTIIATSEQAPRKKLEKFASLSHAHVFVCGKKEVDLPALVEALGAMGMKKILIEGGSELNAKALQAGIVGRLYIFLAPKLIGGAGAKGMVGGTGVEKVAQALRLELLGMKKVGEDVLLEYSVIR